MSNTGSSSSTPDTNSATSGTYSWSDVISSNTGNREHSSKNKSTCLFHHKKERNIFQFVLNTLSGKAIPLKDVPLIGKQICCCGTALRENINLLHSVGWPAVRLFFIQTFNSMKNPVHEVREILEIWLRDNNPSKQLFLIIIKNCLEKYPNLFEKRNFARKFCKQPFLYDITICSYYIQYIFGKKGCHIKYLCKEYNCEIRFDIHRWTEGRMGKNREMRMKKVKQSQDQKQFSEPVGHTVQVKIYAGCQEEANEAYDALTDHATRVMSKRLRHEEAIENNEKWINEKKIRRQMEKVPRKKRLETHGPAFDAVKLKEEATATYDKKARYHHKHKHTQKAKCSVLDGGTCRNCNSTFKHNLYDEEKCRYHPGYLKCVDDSEQTRSVWTCCEAELTDSWSLSKSDSHRETGCEVSRHVFVPKRTTKQRKEHNFQQDVDSDSD